MAVPESYKAIELWGKELKSAPYYIHKEQKQASDEDAPIDAIYKDGNGVWRTIRDLHDGHHIKQKYHIMVNGLTGGQ